MRSWAVNGPATLKNYVSSDKSKGTATNRFHQRHEILATHANGRQQQGVLHRGAPFL